MEPEKINEAVRRVTAYLDEETKYAGGVSPRHWSDGPHLSYGDLRDILAALSEARRRAVPVAGPDRGERRKAAKKLLRDVCACAAETDESSLDLPHVASGCLEPLETLICERDACLFLSQEAHKYAGRDGHDIFDAIAEKAAANARAARAEAELADLKRDAERWRALMRCGRIKMQGSAGVDPETGERRNGSNVHFGAEFWPERLPADYRAKHPEEAANYDRNTRWGVACLVALADAVVECEAAERPDDRPDDKAA